MDELLKEVKESSNRQIKNHYVEGAERRISYSRVEVENRSGGASETRRWAQY